MISIQAFVMDAGQTVAVPRALCPKAKLTGGDAVLMFCRADDRVCTHYAGCGGDGSCGCKCGETLAEVEGQMMPNPPSNQTQPSTQAVPPSNQPATQRRQLQPNEEVDVHTTDGTQQRVRVVQQNPDGSLQVMPVASRRVLASLTRQLWGRFSERKIDRQELATALLDVIAESPLDFERQAELADRLEAAEDNEALRDLAREIITTLH